MAIWVRYFGWRASKLFRVVGYLSLVKDQIFKIWRLRTASVLNSSVKIFARMLREIRNIDSHLSTLRSPKSH